MLHVLIVDDNQDDYYWIAGLLREDVSTQYDIKHADCMASALTLLVACSFDLIIADWQLPDGTGVELAEQMGVTSSRVPVIVITGLERPKQGSLAVGRGAADFLPKDDLTARGLARACSHAVARARLEREVTELRSAERAAMEGEREARVAAEVALSEEKRARKRVAIIQELSSALSAATTVAEVASAAVSRVSKFEGVNAVSVFTLHNEELQLKAAAGFTPEELAPWQSTPLSRLTVLSDAVQRGQSIHVESADAMRAKYGVNVPSDKSWLVMPMTSERVSLGVLSLRFNGETTLQSEGFEYFALVTQCIAEALYRARLYEDAQEAAEFEERLLAVLGHDLRTPLNAIQMALYLLQRKDQNNPLLERIRRSTKTMGDLINDILDRAAVRRGLARQKEASTDIAKLMEGQVDELRAAFPQSIIIFEPRITAQQSCDPVRVSQIVANLVRNAIQHGAPGSPVTVSLSTSAAGSTLSVHNLGNPIPPDELAAIFNPFRRGHSSRGVGLGLFIVHETVTLLGGKVTLRSDDSGTTFTVVLPAEPGEESALDAKDQNSPS